MEQRYVTVDLFAGAGGLGLGFSLAGLTPMAAVEYSKQSLDTYRENLGHPALKTFERDVTETELPEDIAGHLRAQGVDTLHVLSAGIPCETFSVARRKTDPNDTRFFMYQHVMRYVKRLKPLVVVLENVKQLKTAQDSRIFNDIIKQLRELDYEPVDWLLNAANYGVPQTRERLVIVAVKKPLMPPATPPPPTHWDPLNPSPPHTGLKPWVSMRDALSDLPDLSEHFSETQRAKEPPSAATYRLPLDHATQYGQLMRTDLHLPATNWTGTLMNHVALRHTPKMVRRLSLIRPGESLRELFNNPDVPVELKPKKAYNIRCRRQYKDRPSFTVTAHCVDELLHYQAHRQITPREAARLQSFPDWFKITGLHCGHHGDARTQDQYEQMGDAVPPLLAYAVAKQIVQVLNDRASGLNPDTSDKAVTVPAAD